MLRKCTGFDFGEGLFHDHKQGDIVASRNEMGLSGPSFCVADIVQVRV